jgi:hypothetical protein
MRIALALAALLAATPALAANQKSAHAHLVCHKTGERVGGLKKTCYYDCGAFEGGRQEYIYDHCPSWTLPWRLNRDSQFGPRPRARKTAWRRPEPQVLFMQSSM